MNTTYLLLLGFASTVIISVILGVWSRRNQPKTLKGFFWADNNFTVSQGTHLNLSTSFSINGVLYSAWLGYVAGWASLLPQVIWCAGYLFLSRYSTRLSLLSRTGTLHGNIGYVFGKSAARWAAVASLIGFTLLFGWELFIGSGIFQSVITDKNLNIEAIVYFSLAGIVAAYCMLGGLRGNLWANEFQNYLSAIAVIVAIVYLGFYSPKTQWFSLQDFVDLSTLPALVKELTVAGIISNIILFSVYQFLDMSMWQNIASISAKTDNAKKSLWFSAFWIFVFPGVAGSALGMVMRSYHSGIDQNNIINQILLQVENVPLIFLILIMGFFAMMLSTVDGLLLAACQTATWDIIDRKTVLQILTSESKAKFTVEDIRDFKAFGNLLRNSSNQLSRYIWNEISDESKKIISSNRTTDDHNTREIIIEDLNRILSTNNFYDVNRFEGISLSEEPTTLLSKKLNDKELILLNRWLFEDAFPVEIFYNQHSYTMRRERAHLDENWSLSEQDSLNRQMIVLDHSKYVIFFIALVGGILTLILVRKYGVNSFNLIYVAYVAQMALFPSIWSILHGREESHPRSAIAIAAGLIAGFIAVALGFKILPQAGTWAPVVAFGVACLIHYPFSPNKTNSILKK